MPQPAFTVAAINLQLDMSATYGPFPGYPHITYEFVRCQGDYGDHIFTWEDVPELSGEEAEVSDDKYRPETEGWVDEGGVFVPSGWRRCYDKNEYVIDHATGLERPAGGSFGIGHGPFWSDLSFHVGTVPDDYVWDARFNELPTTSDPASLWDRDHRIFNPITRQHYMDFGGYSWMTGEYE